MRTTKLLLATLLIAAIGAPLAVGLADMKGSQSMALTSMRTPFLQEFAPRRISGQSGLDSLELADEWLNSLPLNASALRGKVVLIDFWTYTCINWFRTLPYVRAWAEKYKQQGLVVVGVHSPEFEFEKMVSNVEAAVKDLRISYPVAVDTEHKIWRAFNNRYWPALYFFDSRGRLRNYHFGEGAYQESERIIQELLAEAGQVALDQTPVSIEADGLEAAPDWANLRSAETYVGHHRGQDFRSPGGAVRDEPHVYDLPTRLRLNDWALSGNWTVNSQAAALNAPGGRIVHRFHARDLHLVMGPAGSGEPVRFRVLIDGQAPGAAHGSDIDQQGHGTVSQQRLYQLIRQQQPVVDRTFEIEFFGPGVEAYAFTFG